MQNQIALITPAPSSALKGHYKNLTEKTRCISRGQGMGEEDCRVASGQIKMQAFYSSASVFCVPRLKEDLALCIFLIVICG